MSTVFERIYQKINEIPPGSIATYGMVAKACGKPRGAQIVGWALGVLKPTTTIPWHRVVAKHGRLSITNMHATPKDQQIFLEKEGVVCEERDGSLWVANPVWHTFSAE
jgi:methylated-DNA-protein-cysteine methyltransferase-like protein